MANHIDTIIFDLGGVLLDWNPLYVYTDNYFESQEKRDYFFSAVCNSDWNEEQDAGRPISEGTEAADKKIPGMGAGYTGFLWPLD